MGVRVGLAVVLGVAIATTAWVVLTPDGPQLPTDPGGAGDPRPGPEKGPAGGNGKARSPGQKAHRLLTSGPEGGKSLAELARTTDGARALLEGLDLATSDDDRARLQLHLLLGGTAVGRKAVLANARGEGRPRDQMSAVMALAGGDADAVAVLEWLLGEPKQKEVFSAAVHALALRGDDLALFALEQALARIGDRAARECMYVALYSAPQGHAPSPEFLAVLNSSKRAPGLANASPDASPYRRLVDRISSEAAADSLQRATEVLMVLPGRVARAGVLTLWRRSEGEHRTRLSEFVVQSMQPEWAGAVECLVGILRETKEEDAPALREQVLNKVRTTNRRAAIPALSEWARTEADPGFREQIEQEIARIEAEGEGR